MAKKKRTTLPKNFGEMLNTESMEKLKAVFDVCELEAHSGFYKETALHFNNIPENLVRWLVEHGLNINVENLYGQTPLISHTTRFDAKMTFLALLLDLGADIEARDTSGNTALHTAAGYFRAEAARLLIARGANIHAENNNRQTPLTHALINCSNSKIAYMAEIAALFLDTGAKVTPDMLKQVENIGKEFEFHREAFNKEYLAETDAGLTRLYELFGVAPAEKRIVHDGTSLITVKTIGWKKQHGELWNLLVPSQGAAKTVQGEVIRISGRISDELYRNGGANWDADYRKMLNALLAHLGSGVPLASEELAEARLLISDVNDLAGAYRLSEFAVKWVLANPMPFLLEKPLYRR